MWKARAKSIASVPRACPPNKRRRLLRASGRRKERAAPRNLYFILVISRIVRLPARLRVLRTLNSALSRTIQARNHIVRVPAIVRVLWFGTYPHYRGHPTVRLRSHFILEQILKIIRAKRVSNRYIPKKKSVRLPSARVYACSTNLGSSVWYYVPHTYVPRISSLSAGYQDTYM